MNIFTTRPTLAIGTVCIGALLAGGCVARVDSEGYRSVEQRTFALGADRVHVTLATFGGSIEVRSWDRPQVAVEIVKRGGSKAFVDAIEIHTESSEVAVTVEVRRPPDITALIGMESDGSAGLVATVPVQSDLVARSGDGAISVERITGRIELRTEEGRVRGIDLGGDVVASAGSGSVGLDAVDGRVDVASGDGRVNVDGRLTGLQIETGDGSIRVRADTGSSLDTNWDVWTGDGGIVMTLPHGLDASLDAQTASGTVRVRDDMLTETQLRERSHLRGRVGAGGRVMRIRTADGSIRLRMR